MQCKKPRVDSWVGKMPWRRDTLPIPVFLCFPGDSDDKESACNVGGLESIPGLGRPPGGGHGSPLQYSCGKIPRTEEPGGLRAMGSQRVGHDWGRLSITQPWLKTGSSAVSVVRQNFFQLNSPSSQPQGLGQLHPQCLFIHFLPLKASCR